MDCSGLLQPAALRRLAWMLAFGVAITPAHAAKYTYHGDLMDGDVPAEGAYDLRVRSFANPDASKALGEATEMPGVKLVEGRFSVELDLPEDADGITWVEVAVRKAGSNHAFETLGDPQSVSKANSTCPGAWALDGNSGIPSGSFLGIADAASADPLVLKIADQVVATFTPRNGTTEGSAPAVAFGSSANVASGIGATVGGGGASQQYGTNCPDCSNHATSFFGTIAGGYGQEVSGGYGFVGGGYRNASNGTYSAVVGGANSSAYGTAAFLGAGTYNSAYGGYSVVGGGTGARASGQYSVVAGGASNIATGDHSVIAGGEDNCAGGDRSWAGGSHAKVRTATGETFLTKGGPAADACTGAGLSAGDEDGDRGTFVWADSQAGDFVSSGDNQFAIRAEGGLRWEGTGVNSTRSPAFTHRVDTAASGGNTCTGGSGVADSRTAINHPLLNGNPNAVIVMTPNYGPSASGVAPPRNPLAIYYNSGADGNCAADRWVIYDVTTSPAPLNQGAMFNIWFVLP